MPSREGSALREWAHLAGLILLEVALMVLLLVAGRYLGSVPLSHFSNWVKNTAPGDAIFPLLRLGALIASTWLLATTLLYSVVAFWHPPSSNRRPGIGLLAPRLVRKVVDGVVAATIVVSSIGTTAGMASAATAPIAATARPAASPPSELRSTARRVPSPERARRTTPATSTPAPSIERRPESAAVVNTRVVGRHLPHPGQVDHRLPVTVSELDASAPSPENGFAGLAPGTKVVVVQPGDCLSVLAETYLGNWQRDHEITALNLGRVQPDGRALRDEHWIYPGWVLVMPADAEGALIVGAAQPANGPLPAPTSPATSVPATTPATPATTVPLAPPTISAPTDPVTTAAPARPVTTAAPAGPVTTAAASPNPTGSNPSPPTMVALSVERVRSGGGIEVSTLVQAGLVGAAVIGTIEFLRRRQAQRRPAGRRVRIPAAELAKSELVVARSSRPDRVALIEQAVASLVRALREMGGTPPAILGVLVDADSVEVLLNTPAAPPAPWESSAEGFRWRIGRELLVKETQPESIDLPALVSLGRVAIGSADALINLEAAGLVGISGDPADALGMLYAMAAHLQGAPWARVCSVVLIGLPSELATVAHVRTASSLGEVADELRATAGVMAQTAVRNGCRDAFTGRIRGLAGDGWPPTIVVSAHRHDAEELRMLAAIARPGNGVGAVVLGGRGICNWDIDASARPCPVNPLRLAVVPGLLDDRAQAAVAELVRLASDTGGATRDEPPYDRIELTTGEPAVATTSKNGASARAQPANAGVSIAVRLNGSTNGTQPPLDPDESPIVVKVLGSVEIEGAAEFKRAKSRELAVYLAMHPGGVGESELDEALWGSSGARLVAASTRDATVSVARSALGGPTRLLPAQGQGREKRYQLGPDVTSDWARFCALVRYGREHRAVDAMREALELVRGRPFQAVVSGRTYGWLHTEGHVRHIEAEVADTADLAAGLYLEAGDPLSAKWAARRGLLAEPYTERLWVRLMEAADALGESQEIERIMDEMDAVLELEGDFSGLHPNTLAAYDRLSRRHRHPAEI